MNSRRDQPSTALLTVEAGAERLSTSPRFVRRLIAERRIEFVKVGRHVNLLPRNPCRIRGAGAEEAAERPVLTVAQVFELAEQVGRRPIGNIRNVPARWPFPALRAARCGGGNFNKMSAWPHAVESLGMPGLHFHDFRHTGNHFASTSGAALKDLMARMGHDSERAAMIYQHEAQGADKAITNAIDMHIQAEQAKPDDGPIDVIALAG